MFFLRILLPHHSIQVFSISESSIAWLAWKDVDAYETSFGRPPQMESYLRSQIATTSASLRRLRAHTAAVLADQSSSFHDLFELTNDWSYVLQEMSVLWRPGLYLTMKPISDDWAASAKLMTLIAALLVPMPGLPTISLRARGSPRSWPHPHRLLECPLAFQHSGYKDKSTFIQAAHKLRTALDSTPLLDELWCGALRLGGVLVGSDDCIAGVRVGHLGFITACKSKSGERVFLLSDPEYSSFKMLSYDQMKHFISFPAHNADFDAID